MPFNTKKCKVLRVSEKKHPIPSTYFINNQVLNQALVQSDLGVKINGKLSWTEQAESTCSKANKMLEFIRRSTQEMTDKKVKRSSYFQLVRCNVGYASQIWFPQSVEFIRNIEKIQRQATNYILNLGFFYRYFVFHKALSTGSHAYYIQYWQEYLDVLLLYKILNYLVIIPENIRPKEV